MIRRGNVVDNVISISLEKLLDLWGGVWVVKVGFDN